MSGITEKQERLLDELQKELPKHRDQEDGNCDSCTALQMISELFMAKNEEES